MYDRTRNEGRGAVADLLFDPATVGDAGTLDFVAGILQASTEYSIIGMDLEGKILLWNEGARRLYGYESEEILGRLNFSNLHVPVDAPADWSRGILATALKDAKWEGTVKGQGKNGRRFNARIVITPRRDRAGKPIGFLLISKNISDENRLTKKLQAELDARGRAEAALRESEEGYRIVTQTVTDAIVSIDEQGVIMFINRAAEKIFGYHSSEMLGQQLSMLMPDYFRHVHGASPGHSRTTAHKRASRQGLELIGVHKDGHQIPLEVSFGEYRRVGKHLFTGIVRDVTERKRAQERIRYLAQHDALTGSLNRVLFRDRVGQAIALARRDHEQVAVLFLDLDRFKHVNDSLGHPVGDELLRRVAQRLHRCLRKGDSVGRLGGDEFVISSPLRTNDRSAMRIAEKILEALREPFLVNQNELHISASIGISLYPTDGNDADALMRAADTAMYYAKERGRNNYQFFTQRLNDAARRRLVIANGLHQALQRGELLLDYQPQVDLKSGEILAAEALLRWHHPDLGPLPPSEFVKVAEETGLILPIGDWVLRQACQQLKRWREGGHPYLRIAVNLSVEQFRRPEFPESVFRILRETGLPAAALDLEITEGTLMMQSPENIAIVERLAGTGIQLAVDDFGTGYSSFAYLQRFPIDTIKIDQSFVDGVPREPSDSAIVTAIIAMAEGLKLHVVAEGVETAEQAAFLLGRGCIAAQGHFYHRPLPAAAMQALLG